MSLFQSLGRKALFSLDPETAHGVSITALKAGLLPPCPAVNDPRLAVELAGLEFPNPVGLAAGYDKNAEVPDAVLKLGFGFTEIGTITPRPQPGNPKPRLFRLVEERGVINRLGFNNEGHAAALNRLEARRGRPGIVGVNIGANKDSEDFVADYMKGVQAFAHLASYFTVNISSPNTPGLRNLQAGEALERLLGEVFEARSKTSRQPPVFLKLAPDLDTAAVKEIAKVINRSELDGVMVSNTTLSRHGVEHHRHAGEAGGLSGRPLFERSTIMLARFREAIDTRFPLIGIGGVGDREAAWAKFEAGASLVQLYSCMVFEGPQIARSICKDLVTRMDRDGVSSIGEITGRKTAKWAARHLEE
ncbi:MAG: quinone-dependent dihydroorotate dehydrogenase [Nitratireductor sp.]|nr:quinone-dependent dihydroorotate dehydrogenase [Nitratireductor sp.]